MTDGQTRTVVAVLESNFEKLSSIMQDGLGYYYYTPLPYVQLC